jgi:lysyl oxidase
MSSSHTWTKFAMLLVGGFLTTATAFAQAVDRAPNLTPFPAANISLVTSGEQSTLRFSTTSWNNGAGPLVLVGGEVETGSGKQKVYQRVHLSDGSSFLHFAGTWQFHEDHNHIHFDDYALYSLQPVDAPGGSLRTGQKVTFCLMDNVKVNTRLPGAPPKAVYTVCGNIEQGLSVGWGDLYAANLPGQEIDFTGAADGIYQLVIEVDPTNALIETNKNDNRSCVLLDIRKPSMVTVLDVTGSCSAVASITPPSAAIGTSVQVTIAGYGFTPGMGVTFEGGSGVRPVASNVQLASDTATLDLITATVTVPSKKQNGRDPVWDVRVGGGGLLRDAFTVTP